MFIKNKHLKTTCTSFLIIALCLKQSTLNLKKPYNKPIINPINIKPQIIRMGINVFSSEPRLPLYEDFLGFLTFHAAGFLYLVVGLTVLEVVILPSDGFVTVVYTFCFPVLELVEVVTRVVPDL